MEFIFIYVHVLLLVTQLGKSMIDALTMQTVPYWAIVASLQGFLNQYRTLIQNHYFCAIDTCIYPLNIIRTAAFNVTEVTRL